jgi:hypothetical protein
MPLGKKQLVPLVHDVENSPSKMLDEYCAEILHAFWVHHQAWLSPHHSNQ